MENRWYRVGLMAAAWLGMTTAAVAGGKKPKVKEYDLGSGTFIGDVVRGERTILATNLDFLRYDYQFNSTITFSQPVDLWARLTELAAPAAEEPAKVEKAEEDKHEEAALKAEDECKKILTGEVQVSSFIKHVCEAERVAGEVLKGGNDVLIHRTQVLANRALLRQLVEVANRAIGAVAAGGADLVAFLSEPRRGPSERLVAAMREEVRDAEAGVCVEGRATGDLESAFAAATKVCWVDALKVDQLADATAKTAGDFDQDGVRLARLAISVETASRNLARDAGALKSRDVGEGWRRRADKAVITLEAATQQLGFLKETVAFGLDQSEKIMNAIADLQEGSKKYADFRAAQGALLRWKARMESLIDAWTTFTADSERPNPFSTETTADCGFTFATTKKTAITLTRFDQLPGTNATTGETVLSVTVECTSPFTVAAGAAFSSIPSREFAVLAVPKSPGSTETTNVFGTTSSSSFHPLPMAMIHARLAEPDEHVSFHGSFGLAGNFKSQTDGGSGVEFLIGPSVGLFRAMFFTAGVQIGREATLGAGYSEGDPAPEGVTPPPVQTRYRAGFGFAITFTKP